MPSHVPRPLFDFIYFYTLNNLFVCLFFIYVCTWNLWQSGDNSKQSILSFYRKCWDGTQVLWLGGSGLRPLSHLAGPNLTLNKETYQSCFLRKTW